MEEVVEDWGLFFAEFLLHVEESIVVGVFRVCAVLIFGAGILVDFIIYKVSRDGWFLIAIEGVPKLFLFQLFLFTHNNYTRRTIFQAMQ